MDLEIFHLVLKLRVRWDGTVDVATRYWMNCPEIESQWGGVGRGGEIFRNLPVRPGGSPCLLYKGNQPSFKGVKLLGRGANHSPSSGAKVKE